MNKEEYSLEKLIILSRNKIHNPDHRSGTKPKNKFVMNENLKKLYEKRHKEETIKLL